MYAMVSPPFITCFNRFVQINPHCNIMIVNNKKITKHTKQVNIILPWVAWEIGAPQLGKRGTIRDQSEPSRPRYVMNSSHLFNLCHDDVIQFPLFFLETKKAFEKLTYQKKHRMIISMCSFKIKKCCACLFPTQSKILSRKRRKIMRSRAITDSQKVSLLKRG